MGRKIKVDWSQLSQLSSRTAQNNEEFEEIRKEMLGTVASVSACWQGIDADNFINNASNYLNTLQKDIIYLDEWQAFFKKSAARYNGTVEDGVSRMRNLQSEYNIKSTDRR